MTAPLLTVERSGAVVRLTLDRPPLNVLNIPLMDAVHAALVALPPPPEVRFLVFAGAGAKGFSAGADVADHVPERVATMLQSFHRIFRLLWSADWISIAAVHGHCLGGGMELAVFCDFLLASPDARFGQPEVRLACFPPVAAVVLPSRIGLTRALDLLLTGRTIPAEVAHQWGLVSRLSTQRPLAAEVAALLEELSPLSPAALSITRRAALAGLDFEAALRAAESLYLDRLMTTDDAAEGIRSFLEKRGPA